MLLWRLAWGFWNAEQQSTEWHQQSDPKAAWRLIISTKIDKIEGHFMCVFGRGRSHAALGWVALV